MITVCCPAIWLTDGLSDGLMDCPTEETEGGWDRWMDGRTDWSTNCCRDSCLKCVCLCVCVWGWVCAPYDLWPLSQTVNNWQLRGGGPCAKTMRLRLQLPADIIGNWLWVLLQKNKQQAGCNTLRINLRRVYNSAKSAGTLRKRTRFIEAS